MLPPWSCRQPAAMRTCSEALGPGRTRNSGRCNSEWTSHAACARKARSKIPARNCGRPNRSRVKNRVIRVSRVFYHGAGSLGKLLPKFVNPKDTKLHEGMNEEINISSEEQGRSRPEALTPAPDFAVQPSYVRTVFLGPEGLRAGW